MYRNHEHYPDLTAGRALGSLRRKENQLNTGKQFETARPPITAATRT